MGPAPGSVLKWGYSAWAIVGLDFNEGHNMPKLRAPVGHMSSFIVVRQSWPLSDVLGSSDSKI